MASNINADDGVVSGSAGLKTSADSTGVLALQTNGTTAVTVDTSRNIGFGVTPTATSSTGIFQNQGGILWAFSNLFQDLTQNAYYDGSYKYSVTSYAATMYRQQGGAHQWYTSPTGTAGNAISFTTSLSLGKGTTLALEGASSNSGTGITFPATQSASSNANTLDDYEEGTFTPTLTGSGGGVGTYTARDGIYVKVGKMVTLNFWIYANTKNTLSGNITLTGLPFATSSTSSFSGYRPSPSLRTTALLSVTGFIGGFSLSNSTNIILQIFNNGTATAELNATNLPTVLFEVGGTLSYITD
jgi:hypothetical protein